MATEHVLILNDSVHAPAFGSSKYTWHNEFEAWGVGLFEWGRASILGLRMSPKSAQEPPTESAKSRRLHSEKYIRQGLPNTPCSLSSQKHSELAQACVGPIQRLLGVMLAVTVGRSEYKFICM